MFYGFSSDASMKDKNIIATLKQLSEDESIVIIKPDKGNALVKLNKNDYLFVLLFYIIPLILPYWS